MTHIDPLKGCRVLILEDEYLVGDDLANALRSLGAHVTGPISHVAEALSLNHDCFDVAVLDINLRGHSSYPFADELARMDKPFMFMTGYGAETIPDRFRHVHRREKPYLLADAIDDIAELCSEVRSPVAA
ncbi:CheY-like chemotaxis protein [Bradyrhizobium sp. S3.9.2]|uniref:response regulator n=1 Tax=unclassified Bradyrhizobium TaxID=2631580 RepID=UPI003399DDCF